MEMMPRLGCENPSQGLVTCKGALEEREAPPSVAHPAPLSATDEMMPRLGRVEYVSCCAEKVRDAKVADRTRSIHNRDVL
jgi:hypothetical protein